MGVRRIDFRGVDWSAGGGSSLRLCCEGGREYDRVGAGGSGGEVPL